MKNKKAQTSHVGIIFAVIGVLFFVVLIFATGSAIASIGTGAIPAQQCKSSIEARERYNAEINGAAQYAKDHSGCHDSWWCLAPWEWPSAFASDLARPVIEGTRQTLNTNFDLCVEKLPERCPLVLSEKDSTADKAAECVYRRAVETFYALQGRRTGEKRDFNLFELTVNFDDPGTVELDDACTLYLNDPYIIHREDDTQSYGSAIGSNYRTCEDAVKNGNVAVCGERTDIRACKITFSNVTEETMTLTMISRCQKAGPDKQPECQCFANPKGEYSTRNGLPNTQLPGGETFAGADGATYSTDLNPTYSNYKGCGYDTRFSGAEIAVGGAHIDYDMLYANEVNVGPGDEKVYYTRIQTTGSGVGSGQSSGSGLGSTLYESAGLSFQRSNVAPRPSTSSDSGSKLYVSENEE